MALVALLSCPRVRAVCSWGEHTRMPAIQPPAGWRAGGRSVAKPGDGWPSGAAYAPPGPRREECCGLVASKDKFSTRPSIEALKRVSCKSGTRRLLRFGTHLAGSSSQTAWLHFALKLESVKARCKIESRSSPSPRGRCTALVIEFYQSGAGIGLERFEGGGSPWQTSARSMLPGRSPGRPTLDHGPLHIEKRSARVKF